MANDNANVNGTETQAETAPAKVKKAKKPQKTYVVRETLSELIGSVDTSGKGWPFCVSYLDADGDVVERFVWANGKGDAQKGLRLYLGMKVEKVLPKDLMDAVKAANSDAEAVA